MMSLNMLNIVLWPILAIAALVVIGTPVIVVSALKSVRKANKNRKHAADSVFNGEIVDEKIFETVKTNNEDKVMANNQEKLLNERKLLIEEKLNNLNDKNNNVVEEKKENLEDLVVVEESEEVVKEDKIVEEKNALGNKKENFTQLQLDLGFEDEETQEEDQELISNITTDLCVALEEDHEEDNEEILVK